MQDERKNRIKRQGMNHAHYGVEGIYGIMF